MWSRVFRYNKSLLNIAKICVATAPKHNGNISRVSLSRVYSVREFASVPSQEMPQVEFERLCNETLESLSDFFEILVESREELKGGDVTYSDGVLTANLGRSGIYVINRQTPNRQIWLSSPNSGPKRYDFDSTRRTWVYKHDSIALHTLLKAELSSILNDNIDLSNCTLSEKTI